ncbi:Retrovirus-related Pol polyprotein from transposon TNT 1-94 [Lachnellula cervina]|uniref:Retrovirus-related Pol polyprotein from transposon TNT 1-94 n=1 Tax=Lachnellula cervina TaxID=1316786 RepID=A0A7D8YPL0_9HELO|nr:Retrovirus-related Pol polyprotein from transposon TNT 1-94 [Lachnellula cervina]
MAKYINKILNKFGFNNLNPSKTPIDSNIKLEPNKEQASPTAIKYFQQLIGLLLYLALACRPDITYATIKLARFASNPIKQLAIFKVTATLTMQAT